MRRNGLLLGVALLLAVLALGAACDDDEQEEGPAPTAPTVAEVATPTEEEGLTPEAAEPTATGEGVPSAAATVIVSEHPELGKILTDAEGRTLYTFAEDEPNVSTCQNDPCPQTWPPLTIESGTPVAGEGVPGQLGVIERQDGSRQVTYNEIPLYRFINDTAPGDANGQGIGNRWFVIQVDES